MTIMSLVMMMVISMMLINHPDVVDKDEDENDIEYIKADLWKH